MSYLPCPLCQRPSATGPGWTLTDTLCGVAWEEVQHEGFGDHHRVALVTCRRIALTIAALVAPVVAAACEFMGICEDYDEMALCDSVTAYRDGLRRLGAL